MVAHRPRTPHRRPRQSGAERPIALPLGRVTLAVLAVPVLLVTLALHAPGALPSSPLPPAFDGATAVTQARELSRQHPSRIPGTATAAAASDWVERQFGLYRFEVDRDRWQAHVPGLGRRQLQNLSVTIPGLSDDTIVYVANRDNTGEGPGASNNASGTAALLELARAYAPDVTGAGAVQPRHTLVFLSADGGAYGGVGARRFASQSQERGRVLAVVVLQGLAGLAPVRIETAGDGPRSPAPALVRTASDRVRDETGRRPELPGLVHQLVGLAVPFAYGEQGRFLGGGVSAIRITTADDSGRSEPYDVPELMSAPQLERLGRAAQALLTTLDAASAPARHTSPNVQVDGRVLPGWALAVLLLASLVPFGLGAVELALRVQRAGVSLAPAVTALTKRLLLLLWAGALLAMAGAVGALPSGDDVPLPAGSSVVSGWPLVVIGLVVVLTGVTASLALRRRRDLHRTGDPHELLGGAAIALLTLLGLGIGVALVNPYGLMLLVPSLYAWLALLLVSRPAARDILFGVGLLGPVVAVVSIAERLSLGVGVLPYLAGNVTVGYISWIVLLGIIVWAAAAWQMGAVVTHRYAIADRAPRAVAAAPLLPSAQSNRR